MTFFPFQVVAFDLDGTLADTSPDIAASLNHMLGAMRRPALPLDVIRGMVGHGARSLVAKALAATGGDEARADEGVRLYLDHYSANICNGTRPFDGVETALDALAARGVRLAICTNKPEHMARLLVEALGWSDRFAAIVGADTLAARKPDPAPLLEAVARAGGGRAVFVGDSATDAATARAAGVPFVAVGFGFHDGAVESLGADVVIDSYAELVGALQRL
jgi:phosphoglycolate phosphatase